MLGSNFNGERSNTIIDVNKSGVGKISQFLNERQTKFWLVLSARKRSRYFRQDEHWHNDRNGLFTYIQHKFFAFRVSSLRWRERADKNTGINGDGQIHRRIS